MLPPIDYNTGRGVMYYTTPSNEVLTPVDQWRQEPESVLEEKPVEQLYDKDRRKVQLFQDGSGGAAPQTVTFGPHPDSTLKGLPRNRKPVWPRT